MGVDSGWVFHVVAEAGTLAQHVKQLTGKQNYRRGLGAAPGTDAHRRVCIKNKEQTMRSTPGLQRHTPLTARQEIAALILASAVLVDYRLEAAAVGDVGGLRIGFRMTLQVVQGLWQFLEVSADLWTPAQLRLIVRRSLQRIADLAIPKRRQRSCPRVLRQPVSSWPRLRKNTYKNGVIDDSVGEIFA